MISSRPGQSGRADGYILEGRELEVRWQTWTYSGGRAVADGITCDAVLPEEDQDWQAEARTRGISGCAPCFIVLLYLGGRGTLDVGGAGMHRSGRRQNWQL